MLVHVQKNFYLFFSYCRKFTLRIGFLCLSLRRSARRLTRRLTAAAACRVSIFPQDSSGTPAQQCRRVKKTNAMKRQAGRCGISFAITPPSVVDGCHSSQKENNQSCHYLFYVFILIHVILPSVRSVHLSVYYLIFTLFIEAIT